jgi:hypothetical protein
MMRRHVHLITAAPPPGAPGAPDVDRFAAGLPPRSVSEALRHHRLEQACPHVAPGHVDALYLLSHRGNCGPGESKEWTK